MSAHMLAMGRVLRSAIAESPAPTVTVDAVLWASTLSALRTMQETVRRQDRELAALTAHPLEDAYPPTSEAYRRALVALAQQQHIARKSP